MRPNRPPSLRQAHPREYGLWQNMRSRCFNPDVPIYRLYGAQGVTVCQEWDTSFAAFIRDMGPCPEGKTLELDQDALVYRPGTCWWGSQVKRRPRKDWC